MPIYTLIVCICATALLFSLVAIEHNIIIIIIPLFFLKQNDKRPVCTTIDETFVEILCTPIQILKGNIFYLSHTQF